MKSLNAVRAEYLITMFGIEKNKAAEVDKLADWLRTTARLDDALPAPVSFSVNDYHRHLEIANA